MKAERENCCDDLAVAACGNRQVYAGALAMLAELQLPALSAPAASGWQLLPRIRRIVGGGPDHAPRRASWLPPLLVLGVLAAIGSFMLLGGARAGDAKAAPAKENAHEEVRDLPPDLLKDAVVTDVTQNADPARADEVLASVLVHQDVVYASCPKGLYRASTTDRKWAQIEVPERMPLNGFFAEEASADSSIYYYAPQWTGWKMPKADTKTFGLYRSDASGEKWELLSTDHDFTHVYVHEDKTIYAIAAVTEKEETRTVYYDRILRSTDSGKHWEDISHDMPRLGLAEIFPDPDHKGLVCCRAAEDGHVFQAGDTSYKWNLLRESDWNHKHFFADDCYSLTTGFTPPARLSDYFNYPFGKRTQIRPFRIALGGGRDFKQKEPIVLPVDITFLCEGASATLLDTDHGNALWGMRCILPDGTQNVTPIDRPILRNSPDLKTHFLTDRKSYQRSLDLSAMADFSKPGTYRVQLVYDSFSIADTEKGDYWVGSFRSPVFEIKISPSTAPGGAPAGDAKAGPGKEAATQNADPARPKPSSASADPRLTGSAPVPLSAEQRAEIARRVADALDKAVAERAEDAAALAKLPFEEDIPMREFSGGVRYLPTAIQQFGVGPDPKYKAACAVAAAQHLDDKRPPYRAMACELLSFSFPYEMIEEGLLPRVARLLDDSAPTFPRWTHISGGQADASFIRRLRGDDCVSDAAKAALASATGFGFEDSKMFDAWWRGNSDTHHRLWYWSTRWRMMFGDDLAADLPALVDAVGPQAALKTLLLVQLPTAIEAEMLTQFTGSGGRADHPPKVAMRIPFGTIVVRGGIEVTVPAGVTPEAVAKLVREHSLKPRLLEVLRQERPWPEVKTDETTQVNLSSEVLDVLNIVATKADFPVIQSALEHPTPILKSRSDLLGRLIAILAALDPQRSTDVFLAELRRDPKQAVLAAQIIRTTGLEHWDAIAPFIQDRGVRQYVLEPIGQVRTNRAAAILGELLARENLVSVGRGSNEQDLFGFYVNAANALNDDHPLIGQELWRRAYGLVTKAMTFEQGEQMRREMPAARAEAIEQLKKFFAARAAGPEHPPARAPAAPVAPAAPPNPGGPSIAVPPAAGVAYPPYSPVPPVPPAATGAVLPAPTADAALREILGETQYFNQILQAPPAASDAIGPVAVEITSAAPAGPPRDGLAPVPLSEEKRAEIARQIAGVLDKAVAEQTGNAAALAERPLYVRTAIDETRDRFSDYPRTLRDFDRVSRDRKYDAAYVQAAAKYLDDARPRYRAAACELLVLFPCGTFEEGLLPRLARLLDDSAATSPKWNMVLGQQGGAGFIQRLPGDDCVSDAARQALLYATGFGFADSEMFDTWWQGNRDAHHRLWYWAVRWRAAGAESVKADLPALVDELGPETALRTLLLAGLPTALRDEMWTLFYSSGHPRKKPLTTKEDAPAAESFSNGVKREVVAEVAAQFVRQRSLKPRLLQLLRQEGPWPEVKTDKQTQFDLFYELRDVLKIVATKADAPAIQSALDDPAPVLQSQPDLQGELQGELSLLLASLDPQRSTEVLLEQFHRYPKQAVLAVQIIRTTGLEHWNAIVPFIQNYGLRQRDFLLAIGQVRTNRAAAILGGLLASEKLASGDRGGNALVSYSSLDNYARAATFLNDDHPLVSEEDLLRRPAEATEQLQKFFAARAAGPEHRPAQAPAAPPNAGPAPIAVPPAAVGQPANSFAPPVVPAPTTSQVSSAVDKTPPIQLTEDIAPKRLELAFAAGGPPVAPVAPSAPAPSSVPVPPSVLPVEHVAAANTDSGVGRPTPGIRTFHAPAVATWKPTPTPPGQPAASAVRAGPRRSLTASEVVRVLSKSPDYYIVHNDGGGSEVEIRMGGLWSEGDYTPRADDAPTLRKAMDDPALGLAARLCAAGFLLELNDEAGRSFCRLHLDSDDDPVSIRETLSALMRHCRSDDKEDWAAAEIIRSVENDRLFHAGGAAELCRFLGTLGPKGEPALIAALKRHPGFDDLAVVVAGLDTEQARAAARAALLETVEGPGGVLRLEKAVPATDLKAPGMAEVLVRHLRDRAIPAGFVATLLGDLGDAKVLPALRTYLQEELADARTADEVRMTIVRLEAKDQKDLARLVGAMLDDPPSAGMPRRIIDELSTTKEPALIAPLVRFMKKSNDVALLRMGMYAIGGVDDLETLRGLIELLDRDFVGQFEGQPSRPFVLRDWVVRGLERKTGLMNVGADKAKWQEYLAHLPPVPPWDGTEARKTGVRPLWYGLPVDPSLPGPPLYPPGFTPSAWPPNPGRQ
jgi:hypothetical protein